MYKKEQYEQYVTIQKSERSAASVKSIQNKAFHAVFPLLLLYRNPSDKSIVFPHFYYKICSIPTFCGLRPFDS